MTKMLDTISHLGEIVRTISLGVVLLTDLVSRLIL